MAPRTVKSDKSLGDAIRKRREELGMTIEEAASDAGVSVKSWCRYEAGEAIRVDKVKAVCKALTWYRLPSDDYKPVFDITEYKAKDSWSDYLAEHYGEIAAVSFCIGYELMYDIVQNDLHELERLPRGAHIGQIECPQLDGVLPKRYMTRYDYEFVYSLGALLERLKKELTAGSCDNFRAITVAEEVLLRCIAAEAQGFMENIDTESFEELRECSPYSYFDEWVYDIFDDDDVNMFLYSDLFVNLNEGDTYHFDNWFEEQFYMDGGREDGEHDAS